jgi:GrpB-like predicted nucleotidyltransferase (UPF0157 family)
MPEPVIIAPYDPAWPDQFSLIERRLKGALGDVALDVLHVGSTSVPGLAAKPIIDVDIVIEDDGQLPLVIRLLEKVRYAFEGDRGVPGRYAFSPPSDLPRHHPYVCSKDNRELRRHVAFRDFLRETPDEAAAYAALKIKLARRYGADRDGYSLAKTEFVERILERANLNSSATRGR